jgi:hypothetical protein
MPKKGHMRDVSLKTSVILILILFVAGVGVSAFLYDMRFSIPELFIPWEIKVAFAAAVFILAMFLYSGHKFEPFIWFKAFIVILFCWGFLALANGLVFHFFLNDSKLLMLESFRNALFDFTPTFVFQAILSPFLAYPILAHSTSKQITDEDSEADIESDEEPGEFDEWTPSEDWAIPDKDALADNDIHPDLLFDEPSIEELGLLDSIKPKTGTDIFENEPEIDLAELARLDIDIEPESEFTESYPDADVYEPKEVFEKEIPEKKEDEPELIFPELETGEEQNIDEEISKLFEPQDSFIEELAVEPEFPEEIIEPPREQIPDVVSAPTIEPEPEILAEEEPEPKQQEPMVETISEIEEEPEDLPIAEIDAELERIAVEEIGVELDISEIAPSAEEKNVISEPELGQEISIDSPPEEASMLEIHPEPEPETTPQIQEKQSPTSEIETVIEDVTIAEEDLDIVGLDLEEIELTEIDNIEPELIPISEPEDAKVENPKPETIPEIPSDSRQLPESISEPLDILEEIEAESAIAPETESQIDIGELHDLLDETTAKTPESEPESKPKTEPEPEPEPQSKPSRKKEPKIETISDFADDLVEDDPIEDLDPDLGELLETLGVDLDEDKPKKQETTKGKPQPGKGGLSTPGFGQKPKRESETEKRKVDEEGLAHILNELDGFGEPEFGKKPSKADFTESDLKTAMEESEKKGTGKKAPQFQAGSGNLAKDPSDKIEISVRKIIKYNSISESGAVLDKLIRKGSDHLLKIPLRMIIDQLPSGNVELTVDYIYNMVPIELVNFIAAQQGSDIMELTVKIPMEDIVAQIDPSLMESEGELNSDSTWIGGGDGNLPSFG